MPNQIRAGAVLTYLTLFLNSVIGLIYTPFLTRMLGQGEYGLYSLVASVVGSLTILDFGFGNALIRYTARLRAERAEQKLKQMYGMFFVIFCGIALLSLIVGLILYFNIDTLFSRNMNSEELSKVRVMFLLLIFNLAFTFIMSVYRSIIVAYERFVFQKVINLIRIILNPLVMVVLLLFGYKAVSMVVVQTIFNVLTLCADYYYCKRKLNVSFVFGKFDFAFLKEVCLYSFWIFLNAIMDKVYWSMGQGVLGVYCGAKIVAVYGIAIQLQQMYMSFSTAISGVLLPKITSMVTIKGNEKAVSDLFIRTGRLQFIIMSFVVCGFVLFGKQFILLWVGEEYLQAYTICLLFFFPLLVPLIQNVGITILQARNMMRFRSVSYVIIALLAFVASLPLSKHYGALGCAASTCGALVLGQIIIMNVYYQRRVCLDIAAFWKEICKMSLAPLAVTILSYFVIRQLTLNSYTSLFVAITAFSLVYLSIFWFVSMNRYERDLLGGMIAKILKTKRKCRS
ncbi:MAG: oligosaccharide flippase family protein [Bacteroidales bacterium]|nr:oligosaccharide flippase family protein [Bacteroidales bacterium]